MDNIGMFGDRKNGRAHIVYPHPLLEGILAETTASSSIRSR